MQNDVNTQAYAVKGINSRAVSMIRYKTSLIKCTKDKLRTIDIDKKSNDNAQYTLPSRVVYHRAIQHTFWPLSHQRFFLKFFLYFFHRKTSEKVSYIFSESFLIFRKQNFLIFQESYIQNHGIMELSYISGKVYPEPQDNKTFLIFQKR